MMDEMDDEEIVTVEDEINDLPCPSRLSPSKKRNHSPDPIAPPDDSMDEGFNCSICFEPYTNSGSHRLTCLKCGHLFGKRCITKWINSTTSKKGSCPQCKAKAHVKDIRDHYCRGFKVLDTKEKDEALKDLQNERESKKKLLIDLATLRQRYEALETEMKTVRDELTRAKNGTQAVAPAAEMTEIRDINDQNFDLQFLKRLDMCRDGNSRVMTFFPYNSSLCVSAHQDTMLFDKFGLKKVDMHNLRATEFVPLHRDVIRDVKSDLSNALTASFDKCMILSSLHHNCRVHKWNVGKKVWCCCFKTDETHYVFAGTENGKVKMYDKRMIVEDQHEVVEAVLDVCDLKKPIINLHWIQNVSNSRGLLITSIDRCFYYAQENANDFRPHLLPAEGKLYSVSYNNPNKHMLISYGPSTNKRDKVEHSLLEISARDHSGRSYGANLINSFMVGAKQTVMCRNFLFENPKDRTSLMAAVFNEEDSSLQLWNASSGRRCYKMSLPAGGTYYDTNIFSLDDRDYLCLLNNKYLNLYSFR